MFNEFLPQFKVTLINKGRSNFWQEVVEGMSESLFLLTCISVALDCMNIKLKQVFLEIHYQLPF